MAGTARGLASSLCSWLVYPTLCHSGGLRAQRGQRAQAEALALRAIVEHAVCIQNRAMAVGTAANSITMKKNQGHMWWHSSRKEISESRDSLICIVSARPARALSQENSLSLGSACFNLSSQEAEAGASLQGQGQGWLGAQS